VETLIAVAAIYLICRCSAEGLEYDGFVADVWKRESSFD